MIAGTSYYPDNFPESEWSRDLEHIRDCGLKLVRFGEFSWQWYEHRENEFGFSAFDRFMDLAHRVGLGVVLCTGTAAPPSWLLHHYPQVYMIDQHGERHPGGRHMMSYNEPAARQFAERSILTLAGHYRRHPALHGWQIDNEPTMGESAEAERMYDYHPVTRARFVEFLKDCYPSLADLNRAWHTSFWSRTYTNWEEIEPPYSAKHPGNPGLWLAWMRFRARNVADWVAWQRDLLRSVDSTFLIGTNIPETGPSGNAWFGQDYEWQARGLDYVGADVYAFQGDRGEEAEVIAYSCDVLRSTAEQARAAFWVSETAGGPPRKPWASGGWWGEDFLAPATETFSRHGAEVLLYFRWRAEPGGAEFGGHATVGFDGVSSPLSAGLKKLLNSPAERMEVGPTVYLHYSQDSFRLAAGWDPHFAAGSTVHGWHRWFVDHGVGVNFLSDAGLVAKNWQAQDTLVLPYTTVLGSSLAAAVERAVRAGVLVILAPFTGFFDEEALFHQVAPGPRLHILSGVQVQTLEMPKPQPGHWEHHPEHELSVLTAVAKVEASSLARAEGGNPLIVAADRVVSFLFDLGTLYETAAATEREWLRNYLDPRLSQV